MLHEQLDIAHWKQLFSLTRLRAEGQKLDDFNLSSPCNIAVIEQVREATFASLPEMERLPTDIFLWNRGEPERRAVTKIGGLPYRAAAKSWPMAASGLPMTFVAQFCLVDSLDLVPSLPGDLLLVFMEGKQLRSGHCEFVWGSGDQRDSAVIFEWVSLEEKLPLLTEKELPETAWEILPCYGTIYRTWDFPTADGYAYPDLAEHIPEILEAMKIEGASPSPWIAQDHLGTYLCTLNSVFRSQEVYPFLNVPEPISLEEWRESHPFTIGDMGLMNMFLASDGTLHWIAEG